MIIDNKCPFKKNYLAAERARDEYPEHDWLHLTALIHDLGKIMAFYDEPQWAVVGDTFPVGCKWSQNIVYRNETFDDNVDIDNPKYNTTYGMYKKHCGIENLTMSWGHDVRMSKMCFSNRNFDSIFSFNGIFYIFNRSISIEY